MNELKIKQMSENMAQEIIDAYNEGQYQSINGAVYDAIRVGLDLAQIIYKKELVEEPEEDNMYQGVNYN